MSARFALAAALCVVLVACSGKPRVNNQTPPQQVMKADPQEAAKYNVELGIAYMQRGELAVAKEKLERAVKESPREPGVPSLNGG